MPFSLIILITDIEDKYPSATDVPDFRYPVVQAEITECSTYAIVCRLKSSPSYNITSSGGSFNLPEYPDVCVTIPKKAVASKAKIPLQLKVGILLRGSALVSDHVICLKTPEIALAITILEQMRIILYICVVKLLQCDHLFSLSRLLWPEECLVILYIVISSIWYVLRSRYFVLVLLLHRCTKFLVRNLKAKRLWLDLFCESPAVKSSTS